MRSFNKSLLVALCIMAGVIWSLVFSHSEPGFRVWFLNIGQGDATYIEMPNGKDALIDGGPNDRVLTELGQVMKPYDREINLVVISHNHSDHIAGLLPVLERYEVDEIWLSGAIHTSDDYINLLKTIKSKKIKTSVVKAGYTREFDQVRAEVLYPIGDFQGKAPEDQHDANVVTRWSYGKMSLLVTGDLGKRQVEEIEEVQNIYSSQLLKVPHHGSATGLNEKWLKMIRPNIAVISVGKKNRYGHPKKSVLDLLFNNGVKVFRTDNDGRVGFESDGMSFKMIR